MGRVLYYEDVEKMLKDKKEINSKGYKAFIDFTILKLVTDYFEKDRKVKYFKLPSGVELYAEIPSKLEIYTMKCNSDTDFLLKILEATKFSEDLTFRDLELNDLISFIEQLGDYLKNE